MAKLTPGYSVVTPCEDLRENRPLHASEFAVHLDHIRYGRAHEDYVKPERFTVRVEAAALQAIGEVRMSTDDNPPPPPPGKQTNSWCGEIPPQRWMNSYMKVLSRFASSPELKLKVSFEVTAGPNVAQTKAAEARSGL